MPLTGDEYTKVAEEGVGFQSIAAAMMVVAHELREALQEINSNLSKLDETLRETNQALWRSRSK